MCRPIHDRTSLVAPSNSAHMELVTNTDLIRSRKKLDSIVGNAKAVLKIQAEHGSLDAFVWAFVNNTAIIRNSSVEVIGSNAVAH